MRTRTVFVTPISTRRTGTFSFHNEKDSRTDGRHKIQKDPRTKINMKKFNRVNVRADFKLINQLYKYKIWESLFFSNLNVKNEKPMSCDRWRAQ